MNTPSMAIHKGPHPGILALLYTVLFCVGLYPVTGLYKLPYWPGPWESAAVIDYGPVLLLMPFGFHAGLARRSPDCRPS